MSWAHSLKTEAALESGGDASVSGEQAVAGLDIVSVFFSLIFTHLTWFVGDMYTSEGDEEDPEWVATERQQFSEFRDKNKDGKMDKEETLDWILPSDYDHAEAEAKHLLHESDANQVKLVFLLKSHRFGFTCSVCNCVPD